MKKYLYSVFIICAGCLSWLSAFSQSTFTEVLFPQYMYGNGTTGGEVAPFAFRAKLSGLAASTTYRYNTLAVLETDSKSSLGVGASLQVNETAASTHVVSASPAGTTVATFTADGNGEYTGWFVLEALNNAKFTAGNEILVQINALIPGQASSAALHYYSTSKVKVLNAGTGAANLTAIRSTAATAGVPKNFVMLYDTNSPDATTRPIAGALMESDGFSVAGTGSTVVYAAFYKTDVDGTDKAWGTYIPNTLANGIRKIIRYNFDGTEGGSNTSADGSWAGLSGTVATVNPTGGTASVIVLDGSAVTLAVPPKADAALSFPANFPAEKFTGDDDFAAGVTSKSDGVITYSSSDPAVATVDATGLIHLIAAGTTDIKAIQAATSVYGADTAIAALQVSVPKSVPRLAFPGTFPATVIMGTADFAAGVTSDAPAVITYISSDASVATIDAGGTIHITGMGVTEITASQAADATYTAATVKQALTVVDKPVPQVSFLPFSVMIYGDASFDPGATVSSGAAVVYTTSNPSVAVITNGKVQITGAGTAVITATFPATSNYSQASAAQTLTVQKKNLSVIADDKTKKQGEANPLLTATYIGFVNGDTNTTALQTQVQLSTTATTSSGAGVYPISVNGAASANYAVSYVPGNLTVQVNMLDNVITFGAYPVKVYGAADFDGGATVTSGLTVTYTSSNTSVAVVSGTKIHIVGAGTTVITASQAGDATHVAAASLSQTLTVNKALLTVTANSASKNEGDANPALTVSYGGFVNNENESVLTSLPVVTTAATSSAHTGVYAITVSAAAAANYDFLYVSGTFTVYPSAGADNDELVAYCDAPGQLKVSVLVHAATRATIQLFDVAGKKVVDMPVSLVAGYNIYHINAGTLATGVYPLRVAGGDLLLKYKAVIR